MSNHHEPALTTRERILREASKLFAERGYHGTTTRDVAAAVGIRQPSLFHHYPSKWSMMEALITYDLDTFAFVEPVSVAQEPAAQRLYRYVSWDVDLVVHSPYDLSGIYTEEVLRDPRYEALGQRGDRLHASVERIVKDGIASGEFVAMDPAVAREAIYGIILRTMMKYSGGRLTAGSDLRDQIASFVLRGLLADASRLDAVRRAATGG